MKMKKIVIFLGVGLMLLGNGCLKNNAQTIQAPNQIQAQEKQLDSKPPLFDDVIRDSYLFIVDNKNGQLGEPSSYGIFGVKIDCSSFFPIDLSNSQLLDLVLSEYENKVIDITKYDKLSDGKIILKEIKVDDIATKEIDNFKKTCPAPFKKYMSDSFTYSGVSLYVKSLEQSTKNILAAAKEVNIVEYQPSQLNKKEKVKTLFLKFPNDKASELEGILSKEATNKVVFGAKSLYGVFLPEERPKNGSTKFEISLIDVSILK